MQKKLSGFDSIISIGSVSVCGKFASSVFPIVVKYMLKLLAMSVLPVQGTPLDVIIVSVTVVFCFCFSVFRLLFPMFFPHYFYACQFFLLKKFFFAILIMLVNLFVKVL